MLRWDFRGHKGLLDGLGEGIQRAFPREKVTRKITKHKLDISGGAWIHRVAMFFFFAHVFFTKPNLSVLHWFNMNILRIFTCRWVQNCQQPDIKIRVPFLPWKDFYVKDIYAKDSRHQSQIDILGTKGLELEQREPHECPRVTCVSMYSRCFFPCSADKRGGRPQLVQVYTCSKCKTRNIVPLSHEDLYLDLFGAGRYLPNMLIRAPNFQFHSAWRVPLSKPEKKRAIKTMYGAAGPKLLAIASHFTNSNCQTHSHFCWETLSLSLLSLPPSLPVYWNSCIWLAKHTNDTKVVVNAA